MKLKELVLMTILCASNAIGGDWKPPVHLNYGEKDGIYMLTYGSTTQSPIFEDKIEAALSYPYVKGIAHYQEWRTLEPREGNFDWRELDNLFKLAKEHKKYVIIGLQAGVMAPKWALGRIQTVEIVHNNPGWTGWSTIKTPTRVGQRQVTLSRMPVPWCPIYQSLIEKVIKAIADRYDGDPAITYVNIHGPSASAGVEANFEVNWKLTQAAAPTTAEQLKFTYDKYAAAWKRFIDIHFRHFKKSDMGIGLHYRIGSSVYNGKQMVGRNNTERMKVMREIRDYFLRQHALHRATKGLVRNCGLSERASWGDPDRIDDKPASIFTALQWEVRNTAHIGYECAQVSSIHGVSPADFRRLVHNGITGYGRHLEIKVPDIVTNKRPYRPYAPYRPVLEEAARIMQCKRHD